MDVLTAAGFKNSIDVSRETLDRLSIYVDLLNKWQKSINLVGPKTVADVWQRHILDSAQLFSYIENRDNLVFDLG
ncbi:MAG: class I SAM-dependent methyltransferase, partial [Rhodospirillales bacterium]|nr:class I SAM-dependent methyltransferase [Rhodospirillales bacterium]